MSARNVSKCVHKLRIFSVRMAAVRYEKGECRSHKLRNTTYLEPLADQYRWDCQKVRTEKYTSADFRTRYLLHWRFEG